MIIFPRSWENQKALQTGARGISLEVDFEGLDQSGMKYKIRYARIHRFGVLYWIWCLTPW